MDELLESCPSRPGLLAGRFDDQAFTSGLVSGTLEPAMVLDAVRVEAHDGFDRIVFTLHCPDSSPDPWADLPAVYAVSAHAPPFTDVSGKPLAVEGRAFLRVHFLEMYGHPSADHASPAPPLRSGAFPQPCPAELPPGLEVVAEVCPADDFEGYLEWIIGLTRGARWRVSCLDAPVQLLVDVEAKARLAPDDAA